VLTSLLSASCSSVADDASASGTDTIGGGTDAGDRDPSDPTGSGDGATTSTTTDETGQAGATTRTREESDGGGTSTGGPDTDTGGTATTGTTTAASEGEPVIGLVQYDADQHFGEYDTNMAALTGWALEAVARDADIILLPEGSAYGYADSESGDVWCRPGMDSFEGRACHDVSDVAEIIPGGPTTVHWQGFAAEHGVYVLYSLPEVAGGHYYNALGVVGPDGYVTKYRKRMLYFVDQAYAEPGGEYVVLETPLGDFGLMICLDGTYDAPDAPYYDGYNALGVDAILISMDWDDDPYGPWAARTWFVDRARRNAIDIYAADVSPWDGTGKYPRDGGPRERDGLPPVAIGQDGVSVHVVDD
jgi:predicted amidohydrolase